MSEQHVYFFGNGEAEGAGNQKTLLGGKGANLAEMTSVLRLPVPPGFTISTDACRMYMKGGWPSSLDAEIATQIAERARAEAHAAGLAEDVRHYGRWMRGEAQKRIGSEIVDIIKTM